MNYAPVIIPTLNRVDHLRRCVNSLLGNAEAEYTELFISVDYPPSEKYRNGYQEVKDYVKTIKGFKKVNVFYQECNLGPGLNVEFLINQVRNLQQETYIITEDDNEFSANYLSYVNWALNEFKNDPNIFAVCSKSDFSVKDESDYFKSKAYSPYGTGFWLKKLDEGYSFLQDDNISRMLKTREQVKKITSCSQHILSYLASDLLREVPAMRGRNDQITHVDIWMNVYCIVKDKYNVYPIIPKSRNWGNDGSGVHSPSKVETYDIHPELLDDLDEWTDEPVMSAIQEHTVNQLFSNHFPVPPKSIIRAYLIIFLYNVLRPKQFERFKTFMLRKKEKKTEEIYYG